MLFRFFKHMKKPILYYVSDISKSLVSCGSDSVFVRLTLTQHGLFLEPIMPWDFISGNILRPEFKAHSFGGEVEFLLCEC